MLKIYYIIFVPLILWNCTQSKQKEPISFQEKMDSIIVASHNKYTNELNEIKKKEITSNYDDELSNFLKSQNFVQGFKGTIYEKKGARIGDVFYTTCKIKGRIDNLYEVPFNCILSFEPLKNTEPNEFELESPYHTLLMDLKDYDDVYFDGFFARNSQNNIAINGGKSEDALFKNSEFNFNLINISKQKGSKLYSKELLEVFSINRKIFDTLNDKVNKKINQKEWEERTRELTKRGIVLEKKLSDREKVYSNMSKQYFTNDYMD